jgi:hypothetical protein
MLVGDAFWRRASAEALERPTPAMARALLTVKSRCFRETERHRRDRDEELETID